MLGWLKTRGRRLRIKRVGKWLQAPAWLLVFGPIYAIVLGWLENDVSALLFDGQGANGMRVGVALAVVAGLSFWLWKVGDEWIPVRGLKSCNIDHAQVRMLCVLVSRIARPFRLDGRQLVVQAETGSELALPLSGDIDQDRQMLSTNGLRMQQHLLSMLRPYLQAGSQSLRVLPVLSEQTAPYFESLRDFLARYGVQLIRPSEPPFPDGYAQQQIHEHINALLQQCVHEGYRAEEVVFDTSGGTSSMSVAATLATLHHDIRCQIVDTNDPDKVVTYRVNLQRKPASFE